MLVLLVCILLFHVASAALLFIATIHNAWWVGEEFHADIWKVCVNGSSNCTEIGAPMEGVATMQTVQVSMVLSTTLCCLALLIFLLQLFRLKQGERFVLTSVLQLLSCLCVMIAASVYADQRESLHQSNGLIYSGTAGGAYGYAFALAWLAFACTLLSSLMYLVLRKRK